MLTQKIVFSVIVLFFGFSAGFAGTPEMIIEMIGSDIVKTRDNQKRSTLHIYRARQYAKIEKWDEALDDYSSALELDHKGWIHLERSQFLLRMKKYDQAREDAMAAKKEVPTLTAEADKVIERAEAVLRREYEVENPPTIIMNSKVDPSRKTRFDMMRKQGVFASRIANSTEFNAKRTAKRKQQTAKAASSTRSRG